MTHELPTFNVTIGEAAQMFGLCYHTVWRMCRDNKIRHARFGRTYRLNSDDLAAFVQQSTNQVVHS